MPKTNTDHDETLKEQIEFSINNGIEKGIIGDPQLALDIALDEVMQLILQDRERAVREARVDELKSIALVCWDLEDGEDPNDAVAIEVEHRIADLQSTIKTNQSI